MAERTSDHPDPARLAAFGRGLLDGDEMTELEDHLRACDTCCEVLAGIPEDNFIGLLRTATDGRESVASGTGESAPTATEARAFDVPELEIPSSLVLHHPGPPTQLGPTSLDQGSASETQAIPRDGELPPELTNHPRYRIVKRLGVGGMGTVYLAEHRLMDRLVALKVIRRDLVGNSALVERFRREVRAAARLALHSNIVTAYDAEQAGDSHFLVMEFVDGIDLAHLVKSKGALPYELACGIVKQAAEGLEHAFQRGMVHRDIKPQNLMLTPGGRVKILDFGLARFASEAMPDRSPSAEQDTEIEAGAGSYDHAVTITRTNMVLGTADYIAPEQASAPGSADIRGDLYSLGCTLYYLLAGHAPFPDGTLVEKLKAHSEQVPRALTEIRPDIPPELAQVVDRMMAKDQNQRFQRPAEVAEALAPFVVDNLARSDVPDLQGSPERSAQPVATPSPPTRTEEQRRLPQPSVTTQAASQWTRVRILALIILFVGSVVLHPLKPAGWPVAGILSLLVGYAGFFGMETAGWPVAALFALLLGFFGYIRLEPPGWPWAAHVALFVVCVRALGLISLRQFEYSLLALLMGCLWALCFEATGSPATGLPFWLVGFATPLIIISYRQLDTLAPGRKLRAWACMIMFSAVGAAAIVYAASHDVATTVNGEGILLVQNDILLLVRAPSTGRLVAFHVKQGDHVEPGDVIGEISQEYLKDLTHETSERLQELRREDEALTKFEDDERRSKDQTFEIESSQVSHSLKNLRQQLVLADQVTEDAARRRAERDVGDRELFEAKEKQRKIQGDMNRAHLRLNELSQDRASAENTRSRARFERQLKIKQLESRLALDREKLGRMSRIVSHRSGVVDQFLVGVDQQVNEGAAVVRLHGPRAQERDQGSSYDSIVFVPAGEGKKINVGHFVEVTPASVSREEYGFIHGRVATISEMPATRLTFEEALGSPELADAFLEWYGTEGLLRVRVKLEEEPSSHLHTNRFRWSTPGGAHQPLRTGTMCRAGIVIERRRLINLIIPWTRGITGLR
jgi:NHLM bacteriocin system secretion protein